MKPRKTYSVDFFDLKYDQPQSAFSPQDFAMPFHYLFHLSRQCILCKSVCLQNVGEVQILRSSMQKKKRNRLNFIGTHLSRSTPLQTRNDYKNLK